MTQRITPSTNCSESKRAVAQIGDVVTAVFDAVTGTALEPAAANIACALINGRRYEVYHLQRHPGGARAWVPMTLPRETLHR